MTLFEDILSEMSLLTEDAAVNDINDAINNMLTVKISYEDGEGGQGERIICPVAYGMSTRSNPVVRAFQKAGPSKSGHKPNWRLFKVGNIKSWENIENSKYNPNELVGLNKDGDKQMSVIYTIAKIGSAKDIQLSKSKGTVIGISSTPITKGDVKNIPTIQAAKDNIDNEHYTANNAIDDLLKGVQGQENTPEKVDKSQEKDYISKNDTINAPETKPITFGDIPGGEKNVDNTEKAKTPEKSITNEPIKKSDLEKPEDVKKSFNDLMNRMDNVNKEEDNEEENEN